MCDYVIAQKRFKVFQAKKSGETDNFLKKMKGLYIKDRKEIVRISSNISLSKDISLETFKDDLKLNIVQDADRINSLGAIGIMRYISYNIKNAKEPSFKTTIENMRIRTNKIMRFIRTKSGKIIAKKHVKIINDFINIILDSFE